jgi:hypothetical protein
MSVRVKSTPPPGRHRTIDSTNTTNFDCQCALASRLQQKTLFTGRDLDWF